MPNFWRRDSNCDFFSRPL